jgi:transcriptional regulator with XRE-family HTH domain
MKQIVLFREELFQEVPYGVVDSPSPVARCFAVMTKKTAETNREFIARRLREVRLLSNASQDCLAKDSGIRRASISKLESPGGKNVRLGTLERLAEALNVDVATFFSDLPVGRGEMVGHATERFRRNVRHTRLSRGLSQEDLSELAGYFRTYVGKLERTDVDIAVDDATRLADALEVTVVDLLTLRTS